MAKSGRYTKNLLNELRKKKDLSAQVIADKIGCGLSTTCAYLSGRVKPEDNVIRQISELLGLSYTAGLDEFDKAYVAWGEAHADTFEPSGRGYVLKSKKNATGRKTRKKSSDVDTTKPLPLLQIIENTKATNTPKAVDLHKCHELLYGVLEFDSFEHVRLGITTIEDLLKYVYGIVDFDTYCKLEALAKNS